MASHEFSKHDPEKEAAINRTFEELISQAALDNAGLDEALADLDERDRIAAMFPEHDDERGPYYTTPLDDYVAILLAEFQGYYDEVIADAPDEMKPALIQGLVEHMAVVVYNHKAELAPGDVISTRGYAAIVDLSDPDEDGSYAVMQMGEHETIEGLYGGPVLAPLPDTMFCVTGSEEVENVPFSVGIRIVDPVYATESRDMEIHDIFPEGHTVVVPVNIAGTRFVKHHYLEDETITFPAQDEE